MKNKIRLLITFLTIILGSLFPKLALAQDCYPTDLTCIPTDPAKFTQTLYGLGLDLVGGVGLIFIIYGGYLILSSQGSPEQVKKGRSYITYAIIGIVMAVAGFFIYQFVAVDVIHLPGFRR